MPQQIDVPGVGIVEFPDGMTDQQIVGAIKKLSGVPTAAPMSTADKFVQGLKDPIEGGAQLLTNVLPDGLVKAGNQFNNWLADKTGLVGRLPEGGVDQQVRDTNAKYKAARDAAGETGIDWARLAGNVLSPVSLAAGGVGAAVPRSASLVARAGAGALGGGITSALSPVADGSFLGEKAKQVGLGSVAGAIAPVLTSGIARLVSPNASTNPDVRLLLKEGVSPTIGQTLGGRANALEEKLTSVPVVGDAIANARRKSLEQFNQAAINRATAPIGSSVKGIGQQAVADAGDAIGKAYDDALSSLKYVKFDNQYATDVAQLKQMAQGLTPNMRSLFNRTLSDVVEGRMSTGGTMLADTVKKVDSELGRKAAMYQASSVASEREAGDALKQLQALVKQQVARTSPDAANAIKAADTAWANLVRVEGAAKAAKNADGVFTPAQLNMAVQQADKSVRKRAVARGEALLQDLASAGQNVLGNKVPNSGTAERLMYGGGALGGGYMLNPWIPAGLVGGAVMYSPPAQALLRSAVTKRGQSAQAIAELLKKSSPALGPAAGLLALDVAQ